VGEEPLMRTGRRVQRSPALCGGRGTDEQGLWQFGCATALCPCMQFKGDG
jgi:hypothetical protein